MAQLSILPNNLRVLAADSTSMGTQLLVEALGREKQFHMIQSPSAGAALLALVKQEKPHVAVVSARLGQNCDGYDVVREIRHQSTPTRVIVLLDASERTPVIDAFRRRARGVLPYGAFPSAGEVHSVRPPGTGMGERQRASVSARGPVPAQI